MQKESPEFSQRCRAQHASENMQNIDIWCSVSCDELIDKLQIIIMDLSKFVNVSII